MKAKNTTYSVVYTRAREAIRPVDAGKPQREVAEIPSEVNKTISEENETTSEVNAIPSEVENPFSTLRPSLSVGLAEMLKLC